MAERERRLVRPFGAVFNPRVTIMDRTELQRSLRRIAQEIAERNPDLAELVIVGLQTGGVPLANEIAAQLLELEDVEVAVGVLDVVMFRDDFGIRPMCCSPAARSGLRSTRSAATDVPARCSWRSSSTVDTASSRSDLITSDENCRHGATKRCR